MAQRHIVGRDNLRSARLAAHMTQQQAAEKLGISQRYYGMIENGDRTGDFEIWDALEDLLGVHQRTLRAVSDRQCDPSANQD